MSKEELKKLKEKVEDLQEELEELTDEELEQIIGGGNTTANNEWVNCNFTNNTTQSGGGIYLAEK